MRDKLGQLIFPRIGSNLPPVRTVAEDAERIAEILDRVPIGGLCLFNGSWPETPNALARLQASSTVPLLIASDVERGVGQQIHGLTVFPHAMAFGATGDDAETLVEQWGRITGEQALASGIQMVLGPVADVNSDPRNPIIATRSFGTHPEIVARLVSAYVRGCQSSGAICTAKHFPGHGNTHEDSHDSLPTVQATREGMAACDLLPFQAAIDAGVEGVMTAHVAYPALDPSRMPATVSRSILTDLLRNEMGFSSVIVSDSLLMSGVRDLFHDETAMSVAALNAGVDILLDVDDPAEVLTGLLRSIDEGKLDAAAVEAAYDRVSRLKTNCFDTVNHGHQALETVKEHPISDSPDVADFSLQVARQAITPFGTSGGTTWIPPNCHLGVLVVKPFDARWDPAEQPLVAEVRRLHTGPVSSWQVSPESEVTEAISSAAVACDHLLIAMIVKPAAWHRFGLLPEQSHLVRGLCESQDVTLVSLGVPTVLDDFPQASSRWCTYSDVHVSQRAIAEFLLEDE